MTRELIEAAVITRLATQGVTAYTTDEVNAEGFAMPDVFAEVRVSPTARGIAKGSATSAVVGWLVEVDITGRLAVNVNRHLDWSQTALYGHRLTIDGTVSTPLQEGAFVPASPTGDKRFAAFGEWTFAL